MMATIPLSSSSLLPLLECLEDSAAGASEQTDAYLTIANRLSGENGRQFFPIVIKHFSRLGKALQTHISSENEELSQAALQALGFCVFNNNIVSGIPATFAEDILSTLCTLVLKSTDKNTCTRALWVISKQNFPAEVMSKKTPEILKTLDAIQTKDIQSILMDHESLNVIIKLLEQAPTQMGEGAVCWAKLVIPLVVHSASKVRLRAAAALEMGMPLLLEKQHEVAAIVEPMMSSKLIPEMQKLFSTKNESNVLKLWPLFVRLLGKLLHKGGAFINSLLYLEELGFRSSSPSIKKIAFIAWKSLIDNFALNPEILCSSKRLKLLMQPLSSILVRTEALLLTKLEVWWYLVVKLGPNLAANFDQVGVPLLHSTLPSDDSMQVPVTPARGSSQSNGIGLVTPKSGVPSCSSPGSTPRMSLNSSVCGSQSYSSIQLLGLEMLLHYFHGPEATAIATKHKLQLSLEPLTHNILSSPSFFSKHSTSLISTVRDGFIAVGKDAPEALLSLIWNSLVNLVSSTVEAAGNKKDRQGSEVLTLLLQALQAIVSSNALPAPRVLDLLEAPVKCLPQKVLGSAAYQVANMDVLNGTPALFLILLFFNKNILSSVVTDERFFLCLETLVSCGLSGPTSSLAFGEAVLGTVSRSVETVENREQLWRMWSVVVNPLTDTITQTNEVNQGDALEHNFSAIHSALMLPITNLLPGLGLPQMTQKSMLSTWSRLYKAFARCSALVATAEENVCCEELCTKISGALDGQALKCLTTLDAITSMLLSIIESVDFSPFTPQFQQKMKSPRTPLGWVRKKSKALGNLSSFHLLLVQALEAFLFFSPSEENGSLLNSIFSSLISILSAILTNIALPTAIQESLTSLSKPLALLFGKVVSSENQPSKAHSVLESKLEKLAGDMLGCLQTRSALQFDDELLVVLSPLLCELFPHKSKQIRTAVTLFWNATFGNALVLAYPEMLKPVLNQAKQKAPLILPGFQVENSEDFSGPCSDECSQIDTKVSGIKVNIVGKRDSLLTRAAEQRERATGTVSKPVSVKLDFGSPKPPRREVLEEEASVDFVFIPPETKERVLTEHQKEVKRTKRVDIPAMYNNLDASLDTAVFTQYTQSQEESMDKSPVSESAEDQEKTKTRELEDKESSLNDGKEAQENINPQMDASEKISNEANNTERPSIADISVEEDSKHELPSKEGHSPNVSSSSDVISGTPPKPNSRRQSFITLEKYVEGRPSSPMNATKFTGPLTASSHGQDSPKSQCSTPNVSSSSQPEKGKGTSPATGTTTSQPKYQSEQKDTDLKTELKSVRKHSGDGDEDDVIPDTQSQNEATDTSNKPMDTTMEVDTDLASLDENPEALDDSQVSSQAEPRRSSRRRSKPVRPGDDFVELEAKKNHKKSLNEPASSDTEKPLPSKQIENILPGRTRRSKVLEANKSESGKLQSNETKEQHNQNNSQVSSVPSSSRSRQSRSRSKEHSQTEPSDNKQSTSLSQKENEKESPLSQSESPPHSRSSRRSRVQTATSLEVAGKRQRDDSQNESQSMLEKNTNIAAFDSEIGSQSPARPKRTRKSEATDSQKDKPESPSEPVGDLSQSDIPQVLSLVKGKQSRAEEETNTMKDSPPSVSVCSQSSQAEESGEIQNSSQGRGKYRTRRSSQATSVESLGSDTPNNKEEPKSRRAGGRKALGSEVVQDAVKHEDVPENLMNKGETIVQSVPIGVSGKDSEVCFDTQHEAKEVNKSENEKVLPAEDKPAIEHSTFDIELAKEQQQMDDSKMQTESCHDETVAAVSEMKPLEEAKVASPQSSLVLPEKVELKTPDLRRCPHTKKNRVRRRSKSCKCFLDRDSINTPSQESNDSQDLNEDCDSGKSDNLPSDQIIEKETLTISCSSVDDEECSVALPSSTDADIPPQSPGQKFSEPASPLADDKESPALVVEDKENVGNEESTHQNMEQESSTSENTCQEEPQNTELAQDASQSQVQSEELKAISQKQSEDPVNQEVVDDSSVNEGPEEQQEVDGIGSYCGTSHPENTELNSVPHLEKDGEEETQIDKDLHADVPQCETSEPPQTASATSLESPPKKKPSDGCGEDLDVGQSPCSSVTPSVWSPTASPSTSILKKGQKRQFEEDTPSPLLKSRRVSFANPIYQQELADDIDRRSPVIRTSSPRSKNVGQPKYITTPTKGLLTLSPRNLRSPGFKSSKKCLISEMSQEPRPIPKDCVYPALVSCSTPVEAVLPQISSNMWPRGFGQLVRARNIKTVGDLSALTPSEIKLLPIRSPKLANVRKALKSYYEQQRKGRPDELKGFDEMEKMTSEPEEMEVPSNQEEEPTSANAQEAAASNVASASEQPQEDPDSAELLSDIIALGARLTPEELGLWSPKELGLMYDYLGGMMKSIVDNLQSRLVNNVSSFP